MIKSIRTRFTKFISNLVLPPTPMWARRKIFTSLLIIFTFSACKKEEQNFIVNPTINFTVIDENSNTVTGANISVYENVVDYANAISTKNYGANRFTTATSDQDGKASIELRAGKEFYILITKFDNVRFANLSNISLGGYIAGEDLKERQTLFLRVTITPDDGNIIFYTTVPNKLPINISVSAISTTNASLHTLTGVYGFSNAPTAQNQNTITLYRDPGRYRYYAKSTDGCVWADTINVVKGEVRLVNLSKCESGTISFYTTAINDTLLPLTVKLNEVDTIGNITASRLPFTCADSKTNALTVTRYKGLYNYFISSRSGKCSWTGSVILASDDCIIVPISLCEP